MLATKRIDGATKLVGLLGYPVAHSVSPHIHNHLFDHYGLNLAYVPLAVEPARLHSVVSGMRAAGFVGANVTIPHKCQVIHCCDYVSALSTKIGTVNTLYERDGMLCGDSTDTTGFLRALLSMGCDVRGARVVILGNGGTARTLAFALALKRCAAAITLAARNPERVQALAAEISRSCEQRIDAVGTGESRFTEVTRACTLLVNCTSAGMRPQQDVCPIDPRLFHAGMTVMDTVYNPLETVLIREARAAGCAAQNGLRMLLYQGLASFALWTGIEPDERLVDLEELGALVARN